MASSMEASLVLEPLNWAFGHRQIETDKILIHADHVSQYRANAYRRMLEIHKITTSMSPKGCGWDYPVADCLFSTL